MAWLKPKPSVRWWELGGVGGGGLAGMEYARVHSSLGEPAQSRSPISQPNHLRTSLSIRQSLYIKWCLATRAPSFRMSVTCKDGGCPPPWMLQIRLGSGGLFLNT